MEKTWRWFGPKDKISLSMLRQIGVEGIVTALHDLPNGSVWTVEKIQEIQSLIEAHGMRWSVVESLPVSESIKYGGEDRDALIENYKLSLEALGRCGIKTVCYNFMPVLDWARTDLQHKLEDGSSCLYFDYARFAYFDIKILARAGAEADYPANILAKVEALDKVMTDRDKHDLVDSIIVKTQGFVNGNIAEDDSAPVQHFNELLALYKGITRDKLRENLKYFLEAVMPVCDEWGINMCIHPDDPPMQILGLPRIACNADDFRYLLEAVPNFHNGITFCAGSLSAGAQNNVEQMAVEFADRTHFVHLRTCTLLEDGNFMEAPHDNGRVNLVELIRTFEATGRNLPMRVDHGRDMLGDEAMGYNPGYSFHGRMLALGIVSGMMAAVKNLG